MPIAPGQVSPRLVKTVQSLDTIIISTGEVALSRDDFNIRGNTGLEAPSRSLNLLPSQRQPEFSHIHRLFGSIQLIQSSFDLLFNGILQVATALTDLFLL
jgi:hypothetical protein